MTLTLAGNKQLMAKRSTSIRGKTAKASNLNSVSQPVESPPMLPSRSTLPAAAASRADLSSPRGTSGTQYQPGGGMSAAPITLQAPVSSTCQSIGTRDSINCPMNIVSDTPEPYLEPIKLLNKQSIEERQQNPSSVARSPISSVPSEKTVTSKPRQLTKSCFTGARFPSASSRPIPPPKVLLKRQPSTKEEAHPLPSERKAATTNNSHEEGAKKRDLAYLIVDLQTGRTTISTKNKRTLDDSDVGLKSCKHNSSGGKSSRFPVRSFTMSAPGDQIKRPVVKPQLKPKPSRNTSQDSVKAVSQQLSADGISTIPETTVPSSGKHSPEPSVTMETSGSHDHHHHPRGGKDNPPQSDLLLKERPEIYVSTSTGDSDDKESRNDCSSDPAPPPIPPKRGLGKMTSLPPSAAAARAASVSSTTGGHGGVPAAALGKRLLRDSRTSLPASSIAKDLQQVSIPRSDTEDSLTSSTEKPSSGSSSGSSSHPKPAKNRLPPPKPRPYSERIISPPPPPSFPPPPRPVTASISLPASPPDSRGTTSPVPPLSKSPSPPLSPNTGIRHSHSHQSLLPPGAGHGGMPQLRNRVLSDSNSTKSSGKPKGPKPPPPSRPPPANSKLSQLIAEHRGRSKSTVLTTSRGSPPATINRVKPSISEPRLISTTMRSDSQSLTDLRISESEDIDDIDVIPCSNISYVSTAELFGSDSSQTNEDRPSPLYEDIDALIPLPPPRNEGHNKVKSSHHSPLGGKRSLPMESAGAGAVPELPPKNCYLDHRGRRRTKTSPPPVRAKSPLIKTLSSNSSSSSYAAHADGHFLSSPDSPTDKELREIEELEENRDVVEPYYVKKVVFSSGDEEEEEKRERQDTGAYEPVRSPLSIDGGGDGEGPHEPDVGGVEEYVMMGSVMKGAWETTAAEDGRKNVVSCKSKAADQDRPEESYVEMQPVSLSNPNSPSPISEDISRNAYELDDETEPVYIEMNPEEFVPPTNKNNNKLYYASKDLLSHRPDLQAKKKKSKKLFHVGRK